MADQNPAQPASPPDKYKLFDGFIKGNLAIKAIYFITAPSLVIPLLIEGLEYRKAQDKLDNYQNNILKQIQTPSTNSETENTINENISKSVTHYRDLASREKQAAPAQTR